MNPYFKDYGEYISEKFPGTKVQKISVNAGFSCPNRDGTIGRGGCVYCDNSSFTPRYCFGNDPVKVQLEKGKAFFGRKYKDMKYLAYFQSFSNTFSKSCESLRNLYEEALSVEDVIGLIVGTRPDCVDEEVIEVLRDLNGLRRVFVELGAESSWNSTLDIINRGHTWETTVKAVESLASADISVGLHLIEGLPGESEEMMLETVRRACRLPVESLKFHHLQIIRGTELEKMFYSRQMDLIRFELEDYIDLCVKIINLVPENIAIERFLASSPPEKVISPKWGLKNYQFMNKLLNKLKETKIKQ